MPLDLWVRKALGRMPTEQGKSFGLSTPVGVQGRAGALNTDLDSLISARRRNELVYACIKVKADSVTDPRLIVQRKKNNTEWEEVEGHPLRRLMLRPNPYMDETEFMRAAVVSWDVARVFYAEKVRSQGRLITELHPLDPSKVKEIKERKADGTEEITAYEWKDGRAKKTIKPDDMLVRKEWKLGDALSPLAVAIGAIDADNAQTEYIRGFFNNAGVPSGILTVDGVLQDDDADALREKWRAKFGRFGNQHDIAVLDKNANYEQLGSKLSELDSETLRSVAESRICMAFGVPPLIVYAYVGLLRATYSNLKEAWAGFWDATMSPTLKDWRSFFQWSLLIEFENEELILGERVRLAWDLSQVAALQEDVDALHKRATDSFKAGGITLNEYRAKIGEQPDANGEYGDTYPYLDKLLMGGGGAFGDAPDQEEEADADAAKIRLLPHERKAAIVQRGVLEARATQKVAAYLLAEYNAAADAIRGQGD